MIVRRVTPLSLGKILGAMYLVLGLIAGLIISAVSVLGFAIGSVAAPDQLGNMAGLVFGVGAVVFIPLVYGTLGFIGGLIAALVYNLIAGVVGGVEIEVA
jgi:hypothetical protein